MTEKSPLILEDLNVEDFRAVCWLFFAFPDEISAQKNPSSVEFHRLISIFYITNRYKLERHEKWVHELLSELCGTRDRYLGKCAISDYERLITLALKRPDATLKANTIQAWLRRFKAEPKMRPEAALRFASRHNLRQFQGEISYHELLMMAAVASKNPNSTSMFPCRGPSLVDGLPGGNIHFFANHLHLYWGFFSLSHYSDILRTPPEVPEPKNGHFCCVEHWKKMWEKPQRQEGTGPRSKFPDPFGVLKRLATFNPSRENSKSHLNPEYYNCYFKAEAAAFRKRLVETLADHFWE